MCSGVHDWRWWCFHGGWVGFEKKQEGKDEKGIVMMEKGAC